MKLPIKFWTVSVLLLLVNLAVYLFHIGGDPVLNWTSTLLPIICACIGIAGILLAVNAFQNWDRTKTAWFLLAAGMALSAAGEISYMLLDTVFGVDVEEAGYTIADIFWIGAYVPYLASLFILVDGYRKSGLSTGNKKQLFAFMTLGFLLAAALTVFVLMPILADTETELLAKIVYMFYPVGDFLLIIPAVLLILFTAQFGTGVLAMPWKCIALAFVLWSAADIVYSYLGWNGLYGNGNLIDLLWNISYLLIAAAGLYQKSVLRSI